MSRRKQKLLGGAYAVPRKIVRLDDNQYFVDCTKQYVKEKRHAKTQDPVTCPDCGKIFGTQQAFSVHRKFRHAESQRKPDPKNQLKPSEATIETTQKTKNDATEEENEDKRNSRLGMDHRRHYTAAFKAQVIADAIQGANQKALARFHNINRSLITKWIKHSQKIIKAATSEHKTHMKIRPHGIKMVRPHRKLRKEDDLDNVVLSVMADLLDAVDQKADRIKPGFSLNNTDKTPGKARRRTYSAALKAQVLRDVESGLNTKLLAQIHGISRSLITKWSMNQRKIMHFASSEGKQNTKKITRKATPDELLIEEENRLRAKKEHESAIDSAISYSMATLATLPPDAQVMYQSMLQSNSLHMKDEPHLMQRGYSEKQRLNTPCAIVVMGTSNDSDEEEMVQETPTEEDRNSILRSNFSHSITSAKKSVLQSRHSRDFENNRYIETDRHDSEDEDYAMSSRNFKHEYYTGEEKQTSPRRSEREYYTGEDKRMNSRAFDREYYTGNEDEGHHGSVYIHVKDETYSDDDVYDIVVPRN